MDLYINSLHVEYSHVPISWNLELDSTGGPSCGPFACMDVRAALKAPLPRVPSYVPTLKKIGNVGAVAANHGEGVQDGMKLGRKKNLGEKHRPCAVRESSGMRRDAVGGVGLEQSVKRNKHRAQQHHTSSIENNLQCHQVRDSFISVSG